MLPELERLLDHLCRVLDPRRQAEVEQRHRRALDGEPVGDARRVGACTHARDLPVILEAPLPHDAPFQPLPHHEIFRDPERMLYNELVHGFRTSIALRDRWPDDLPLTVRANFGTVLIASMFGARVEQIGENPPWIRHDEPPSLQAIADRDPLDFSEGWVPRAIETMEAYHDILRRRPELYEMIHIVLPDLQGPLDNLGLVRGSTMFLDLAASPDETDAALTIMATAQIALARHLARLVRDGPPGYSHQHALMIRGNILLRNDSLVMVSPAMYRNQLARHDERVLSELGGGGLHCCGKIDHLAAELLRLPSVMCLDLGQPHLNDIDAIYAEARAVGKPLIRLALDDADLDGERLVERFPTGANFIYRAADEDAVARFIAWRTRSDSCPSRQ